MLKSLLDHNVPAISIPPISVALTMNGRIKAFYDKCITKSLETGLLPVLFGDYVLDISIGFTVLSGDQIAAFLASKLKADRLILGVDVEGLCTSDPKINASHSLIRDIVLKDLWELQQKMEESTVSDVTGGMSGKVLELTRPVKDGIDVFIVSALKPGNILKTLRGEKVNGTRIRKK